MNIFKYFFGKRKDKQDQMISLVALIDKPASLEVIDSKSIRNILSTIFSGHFEEGSQNSFVVSGKEGTRFMIKSLVPENTGVFILSLFGVPYSAFSKFPDRFDALALKNKVECHGAWLSIDCISQIESVADSYRFIGKSLANICPHSVLAVFHPERNFITVFDDAAIEKLMSNHVLEALCS